VPTYDYQCRACGAVIEVIHPMSEDGPAVCDTCGGALRRVLFPAGIIFKGSGFYRNDSRAKPAEATTSTAPTSTTPSTTSTDSSGSASTAGTQSKGDGD
jgi:putative FmdB family regulatory protein